MELSYSLYYEYALNPLEMSDCEFLPKPQNEPVVSVKQIDQSRRRRSTAGLGS